MPHPMRSRPKWSRIGVATHSAGRRRDDLADEGESLLALTAQADPVLARMRGRCKAGLDAFHRELRWALGL